MKIFNVLLHDRHADPEIYNFTDKIVAIAKAKELAKCNGRRKLSDMTIENEEELKTNDMTYNWILLIEYSCEGDYVRVTEGELNE